MVSLDGLEDLAELVVCRLQETDRVNQIVEAMGYPRGRPRPRTATWSLMT